MKKVLPLISGALRWQGQDGTLLEIARDESAHFGMSPTAFANPFGAAARTNISIHDRANLTLCASRLGTILRPSMCNCARTDHPLYVCGKLPCSTAANVLDGVQWVQHIVSSFTRT